MSLITLVTQITSLHTHIHYNSLLHTFSTIGSCRTCLNRLPLDQPYELWLTSMLWLIWLKTTRSWCCPHVLWLNSNPRQRGVKLWSRCSLRATQTKQAEQMLSGKSSWMINHTTGHPHHVKLNVASQIKSQRRFRQLQSTAVVAKLSHFQIPNWKHFGRFSLRVPHPIGFYY